MTAELLALAVALAAAPPRTALPFAPVAARTAAAQGRVVEASRGRAFLDAGARDGLAPGQELAILRGGAPAATCRVEAVADRSAVCAGEGLRAGDAFAVPARPAAAAPAPVPAPLADAEAAARRGAIEAAPIAKVTAKPLPARARARDVEAAVSALYLHGGSVARHQERVYGQIRGAPVFGGLRLDVELAGVLRTAGADAGETAFRPGDPGWVELREAAISSRDRAGPFAFAAGRILPRHAPGAGRIDGAQAAWRSGRVQLGIFGGGMPDPLTTAPTVERATAGVFAAADHARRTVYLREEARVAWVRTPELGSRLEAEGAASLGLARALDLTARARFGVGGDARATGALDEAGVDLAARLGAGFSLTAGLRYVGLDVPEGDPLPAPAIFPGRSRRGDGALAWARGGLTLRVRAAAVRDLETGLDRTWLGPEVQAWLFRRRLGLFAGYLEETGWLAGRSLSVGASSAFFRTVRFHLRGNLYQDEREAPLDALLEAGGAAGVDWDLAPWLALRASALVRYSVTTASDLGGRALVELVARR
ncbi:MAG TPA: hypothetical protein VFL83_09095 [Anaeromyxobacter sp.]|nr:hypothetical protein [Anaeromyxobacter sp.]